MSHVLDMICKCRDILIGDPARIKNYSSVFDKVIDEIHRQMSKKSKDYDRELEFTSQDLREFADDIRNVLKHWEDEMDPEKNIKKILATVKDNKIDMTGFCEEKTAVMSQRRDCIEVLTRTLSILEYHSVYLYFVEEASHDEFALEYSVRF